MKRIPKKLFYKIGEVCKLCDVEPHVLRYWEAEFPLLSPSKNRAGQRIYREKDVELIREIKTLLYDERFTIAGARKRLRENASGKSSESDHSIRRAEALARLGRDIDEILKILDRQEEGQLVDRLDA